MDPQNVAIMFPWSRCFMLTCQGIKRHDDMKYINMINQIIATKLGRSIRRQEICKHDHLNYYDKT